MSHSPRIVFFVGAGFSKSFDRTLPTGKHLLSKVLKKLKTYPPPDKDIIRSAIRGIIPLSQQSNYGFENLLGVLDSIRLDKREAKLILNTIDPDYVWNFVLAVVAEVVRYKDRAFEDVGRPGGPEGHKRYRKQKKMGALIRTLEYCKTHCQSVSIVTTNYDLICDKATNNVHDEMLGYDDIRIAMLDLRRAQHGVPVRGIWTMKNGQAVMLKRTHSWEKINGIPLFKLHGSINWAYCSACPGFDIAMTKDDLPYIIRDELRASCPSCGKDYDWIFIPPVPNKRIEQHEILKGIWGQAEVCLAEADRVIFVGYSLPPSDPLVTQMIMKARVKARRTKGRAWRYLHFDKSKDAHERYCDLFGKPELPFKADKFDMALFESTMLHQICK